MDGNTANQLFCFMLLMIRAVSPLNSIAYYTTLYKAGIEILVASVSLSVGITISLRAQRGKHGHVAGVG